VVDAPVARVTFSLDEFELPLGFIAFPTTSMFDRARSKSGFEAKAFSKYLRFAMLWKRFGIFIPLKSNCELGGRMLHFYLLR
jgi:hypothetical protein